jgi:hypothetical protein
MTPPPDSAPETLTHMRRVHALIQLVVIDLLERGAKHDESKLHDPEKPLFDEMTDKLKSVDYMSDDYKSFLAQLKPALDHHYAKNSHHPQHHRRGVSGMTLMDVVEMFCDWKAATERHASGNLGKSIIENQTRYQISDQLAEIFENTRRALGW